MMSALYLIYMSFLNHDTGRQASHYSHVTMSHVRCRMICGPQVGTLETTQNVLKMSRLSIIFDPNMS